LTSTALTVYKPKEVDQNKLDRINMNLATTAKELMEARKNHSKIEEFIIQFETVKKRPPTIDEIMTNLEHPIPMEVIESVLHDFQDKLNKQSVHEMYEYNDSVVWSTSNFAAWHIYPAFSKWKATEHDPVRQRPNTYFHRKQHP